MKFLIQKINNQIRHDFSFTLLESARFWNWLSTDRRIAIRYMNTETDENDVVQSFEFKKYHHSYIPIGSVEFVTQFLEHFHDLHPKPINVPRCLFNYAGREIYNGTNMTLDGFEGRWVIKDNERIKGIMKEVTNPDILSVPPNHNYQISKYVSIESEWRVFVYKGKMVGLQHYVGEFTLFPDVKEIISMINRFEDSKEAPIAYTLDVGIKPTLEVDATWYNQTIVIEVHDFFSCGLYGFAAHNILPAMFGRWFTQYVNKNKNGV